ncbi:Trp-rich small protein [Staphylococcus lugdunensis]
MTWWSDVITTLLTGGILVIFRIWLENKWKDKG